MPVRHVQMACDRDDSAFILVAATVLAELPCVISRCTSSNDCTCVGGIKATSSCQVASSPPGKRRVQG